MKKIDDTDIMWFVVGVIAAFLVFGVPAIAVLIKEMQLR